MLPGPYYVYTCPRCGNLLKNGSLMSGNTFGEVLYSDGKRIAPMLPEFPDLTKCKKCDTIFWLSKLEKTGTYQWDDKKHSHWRNADNAQFLNIDDYFRALEEGLAGNMKEELFIRQRIWWAYNDSERTFRKPPGFVNDEIKWRENCVTLISLLKESDLEQRIMIAELKRNLGDFESCIDIIKKINNHELKWLKDKIIGECKKRNTRVVQLK